MDHWELKRDDWISHAYSPIEEADRRVGSKLENDIHSMFSFELDEVPDKAFTKARWGKLKLKEYELLCPSLRLATRLLESAPSSDAICSIIYGDRHPSPEKIVHKGVPVSEFHKHNLPPSDVREAAGKVLKRLAKSIRFQLKVTDNRPDEEDGSTGSTSGTTDGYPQGVIVSDRQQERGIASITTLDLRYLKMLKEMLVETLGKQFQILKVHFETALTICHEVMHAINFGLASNLLNIYIKMGNDVKPPPFNEPFHQGQDVAELGYFWENHVFGGACNQSVPIRENPVYVSEWPSWVFRDEKLQPEKAPPKRRVLMWLVSAYYIKNIQTQEFWDRIDVQHSQDLHALRIRKRVAVQRFLPSKFTDYDKTWDPNAPGNWLGDTPRLTYSDDDPSPGARLANETHREREERLGRERQASSLSV